MGMSSEGQAVKKMLVAFDSAKPEKASSDFLVPVVEGERVVLFGTRSKKVIPHGMVVFVGREITTNDVFARLVDSGRKIPVVAESLSMIAEYLSQIGNLKIGQIVRISDAATQSNFTLESAQVTKPVNRRGLP
jgi:hypothetical protein